jgi:LPPG:FO 2-phospho-L-lactate transferase
VAGAEELCVVANTGDDVEVYGVHVSPDPDLVTYWLADAIDERGYGLRDDSFQVMAALEAAGREAWFRLGDRDLAMCLLRTERLRRGQRLTDAHAAVVSAMGVSARVLPMCDEPVRTRVLARGTWLAFQEFMIVEHAAGPVEGIAFEGIAQARPTEELLATVAASEAIVIGPSNPVISIGPILAMPGMREALLEAAAPVVAVSPFVDGRVVKGPTEIFCRREGIEMSASGIAQAYEGLLAGVVADEHAETAPTLVTDTLMEDPDARSRLARETLEFAASLAR